MRTSMGWVLVAGLCLAGCGDGGSDDAGVDAGTPDAGTTDAGSAVDAGAVDAGAADAGDSGGAPLDGGTDGGLADAGEAVDAGVDGGPALDAGAVSITLGSVAVYANCQPIVAADPVIAFWRTTVSDAPSGLPSVTLTSAVLTLTPASGPSLVQTLTVDDPAITLSGGTGAGDQRKSGADVTPSGACGTFCSEASYALRLTFDVGGATVVVNDAGSFGCVY